MKTKEFITTVDKSLLSKEEKKLKRIFEGFPFLTLEQAVEVMEKGAEALESIEFPKKEVTPIVTQPKEPVADIKPPVQSQPKPKKSKPKKK